jgi:hypothetical protein
LLDAAFASWTSSLTERGFDDAFLSLLRANGYYDVHFTHGLYEFGKDVIAKRATGGTIEQHAFQSKSGDVSGSDWDAIYSQMNELLGMSLTHPNFDRAAKQVRHLVTTGRLKGKAILSANDFKSVATTRGVEFIVDDSDTLLEYLRGLPASATIASKSPSLDVAVGRIVGGPVSEADLEAVLGQLVPAPDATEPAVWRSLLDLSICARALSSGGKPLHACWSLLHGIRLGAVVSHGNAVLAKEVFATAMRLYVEEGAALLAPFLKEPSSSQQWAVAVSGSIGLIIGYPVAVARVAEYLALAALFREHLGEPDEAQKAIDTLVQVVEHQPAVARPISDRFAASTAAVVVALAHFGKHSEAERVLIETTRWVCDRYEDSEAGLAGPYAKPDEEVRALLMARLEGVTLPRRRESLLAVALADLTHTFAPTRYADVLNDILAVGIVSMGIHANDHPDAYFVKRTGQTRPLANVRYPDGADEPIAHFALQPTARTPEHAGGACIAVALAVIARDRLFSDSYERL